MKKLTIFTALLIMLFIIVPNHSYAGSEKKERLIVTFLQSGNTKALTKAENNFTSKNKKVILKKFKHTHSYVAKLSQQRAKELKKVSKNILVEKDVKVKVKAIPTENKNWGAERIGSSQSNKSGLTGAGVKVGIIDTGIQKNHPQLSVAGGYNFIVKNNNYNDDNGHGTHVAGIIAGKTGINDFWGVAPGVKLYALKVLDSQGEGYVSDIVSAIDWAIQNKLDIINLSMGTPDGTFALENSVNRAYKSGLLIVAAAGNDGGTNTVEYPAKYSNVISVAATSRNDTHPYFSSTGKELEVSAPGEDIYSTYIGGGYTTMSGTSMATPHVSGTLALYKQSYPDLTNTEIRKLIDQNVIDLGPKGKDSSFGYGLVQTPILQQQTIQYLQVKKDSNNEVRISWDGKSNSYYTLKRNGRIIYRGKSDLFLDKNVRTWGVRYLYVLSEYTPGAVKKEYKAILSN